MNDAAREIGVVKVRGRERTEAPDRAATEEPLEIRLHGRALAVVMRTPGADRELAAGFLLSERVIANADDLGTIEHCRDAVALAPGETSAANIVNITLVNGAAATMERWERDRRQVLTNSSCGLCGRQTIESLAVDAPRLDAAWTVPGTRLAECVARLRGAQSVFAETGGLHGAGLFRSDGTLVQSAEDVGRHNAVDKVIGRMLMADALPLSDVLLVVSGRTSFEIVQKALLAGIPIVAAVSAPSSLAIDLAHSFGMTLVGFVRGDGYNIYTHPSRIT